ncbi:hypothetical protein ACFO0N_01760 [Halobium salinum]|uniref:Uncharacterized protein n=1 Tax=Halobium salinum TaxID=1364940 RepID=A0ABD5P7F4_9EURY|nr:hypothetical protein [Halobium salinum]
MPSSRRALLAAGASALSVGCLGATNADPTDRESETDPTGTETTEDEPARRSTDDCTRGVDVEIAPFAPVEDLPTPLTDERRRILVAAVETGGHDVSSYGRQPVEDGTLFEHDGAFYRGSGSITDSETVPARRVDLSWSRERTAPANATVFEYDELPEPDRVALDYLVFGPVGSRPGGHPREGLSATDSPAPFPNVEDSTLVAEGGGWVRWKGREYEVEVGREDSMTRRTYRFTTREVAPDAGAFRSWAAEQYLFAESALSPPARRAVERAVAEDGYRDCDEPESETTALRKSLPASKALPRSGGRSWYVAVDGDRRRVSLREWVV